MPKRDITKPSLANLAYVLRHEEVWPKKFKWNFGNPEKCAMGLAAKLWGGSSNIIDIAKLFGISCSQAGTFFIWGSVKPKDIAKHIKEHLKENA